MNLIDSFKNFIHSQNLFTSKDKLLVAVSGGIDSVVLCELCKQSGYDFAIAHCNFQLREEDSDRDEKFVSELADKYKVNFHVVKFDTKNIAIEKKIATQVVARELRYGWFEEIRKKSGYQYILTAHHAGDNIETVMMNFFRGTGIRGLRGIEAKRDFIIRPLLFAKRNEIQAFLEEFELQFVSDYTNQQDDYTRNYFRNQVIPFIEKTFPEVNDNILANVSRFRDVEILYTQAIEGYKKKLMEFKENEIHIPVLKLMKSSPLNSIVYEIIKDYGFHAAQTGEVIALLESESGKYVQSSTHRIIRNRKWLIIASVNTEESKWVVIDEAGEWPYAGGHIQMETTTAATVKPDNSKSVAMLDAAAIKFPLLLRKWKHGDYFYPLGMKKKKKLSRFFIDLKLSKTDKEKVWVVEMNKKIIWIVNHRIDDRFKITGTTKKVLQIRSSL